MYGDRIPIVCVVCYNLCMKYYKTTIQEDKDFFENVTAYRLSKIMGIATSYVYRVKDGTHTVSEEQYDKMVKAKRQALINT